MKSEELKNKLHQYIDKATDEELINILSFVEEDPGLILLQTNTIIGMMKNL